MVIEKDVGGLGFDEGSKLTQNGNIKYLSKFLLRIAIEKML